MVRYIWDDPAWPAVHWDAAAARSALTRAARLQGEIIGAVRHLSDEGRRRLEIDALTADAVETSRIEGEILDPASVRRSIARRLRKTETRSGRVHDAEAIAALTIDATVHAPRLSRSRLRRWHQLLFAGDGAFRTDEIVVESGPAGAARIHFEGPPPGRIEAEVDAFLAWAGGPNVPDPF